MFAAAFSRISFFEDNVDKILEYESDSSDKTGSWESCSGEHNTETRELSPMFEKST